jgi:hypothetical protein
MCAGYREKYAEKIAFGTNLPLYHDQASDKNQLIFLQTEPVRSKHRDSDECRARKAEVHVVL